jgi:hypothetical protein
MQLEVPFKVPYTDRMKNKNNTTTELKRSDLKAGDIVWNGNLNSYYNVFKVVDLKNQGLKVTVVGGSYKHLRGHFFPIWNNETFRKADPVMVDVWNKEEA